MMMPISARRTGTKETFCEIGTSFVIAAGLLTVDTAHFIAVVQSVLVGIPRGVSRIAVLKAVESF
jgi:hypothetical protein